MKNKIYLILGILLSVLFLSCDKDNPEWKVLKIKEDKQIANPYYKSPSDGDEYETWMFDQSAKYDLGDSDNCDINKLHIISYGLLDHRKNYSGVGWRWDERGFWWVMPYDHKQYVASYPDVSCGGYYTTTSSDSLSCIKVYPEENSIRSQEFSTEFIDSSGYTILVLNNHSTGQTARSYYNYGERGLKPKRIVGAWFGGNRNAPHDIYIYNLK